MVLEQRTYGYDLVQEEEWQRQASRNRIQMRRRQIQLGQVLQSVAAYAVRGWQQRIEQQLPLDIRPDEVLAMLKLGNELEAKGHGEEKDGGRFTRINVVIGTATDLSVEESCRKIGGRALPPGPIRSRTSTRSNTSSSPRRRRLRRPPGATRRGS
jgi:hypothetical protein